MHPTYHRILPVPAPVPGHYALIFADGASTTVTARELREEAAALAPADSPLPSVALSIAILRAQQIEVVPV